MNDKERFLLDTNIAVYAVEDSDPSRQKIAMGLISRAHTGSGLISYQVVQEWFNVILRKSCKPMPVDKAVALYRMLLEPIWRVHSSPDLVNTALDIQATSKISWWDALIVSAAIQGGCKTVYSEDLQHGAMISGVRVINPFRADGVN